MPQSKTLLQELHSIRNLRSAWREIKKYPRSHGLSSETIEEFGQDLERRLRQISNKLRRGTFKFSKVKAQPKKEIRPSGQVKRRVIFKSNIPDRVVQRAIARLLEPILAEKYNLYNDASFAYLKRRGSDDRRSVRDALARMITLYREGRKVVLEADIVKYFDNVDKDRLLGMVLPCLPDGTVDTIITNAINQEIGNRHEVPEEFELFSDYVPGIPQGGGLSPLFANVYLSGFDSAMLSEGFGLVRYADDFIVLCRDESEAERAYERSKQLLEGELKLQLHPRTGQPPKTQVVRIARSDFQFLGVRFDGPNIWPSKDRFNRFIAKIRKATEFNRHHKPNLARVLYKVNQLLEGWIASYCFADLRPYIGHIETTINERVGTCANRMGWLGSKTVLSARQRKFSGISSVDSYWTRMRENMSDEEKTVFILQPKQDNQARPRLAVTGALDLNGKARNLAVAKAENSGRF